MWTKAQAWERDWHSDCRNTLGEELKQLIYAEKMGLTFTPNDKTPYNIDLKGKSVIDIGGGPASLLLKCINAAGLLVVDPLEFPTWVYQRYIDCKISVMQEKAEDLRETGWDEVWIYNCLQHTEDPEKVIERARASAKLIRIFEWIDTSISAGHLQVLTEKQLNQWLGGEGKVENFTGQNGCHGKAYYGIFVS